MFTRRAGSRAVTLLAAIPAAALVTLAVAACGTGSTPGGGAASPAPSASAVSGSPAPVTPLPGPVAPEKTQCTGWPSAPAGTLPASFVPVKVLRCVTGYTTVPGKGYWLAATMERGTGDLAALANALRAKSVLPQPRQICPAYAMLAPDIVLAAADGTAIRPQFPVTACGEIQQQVLAALAALQWHNVSQHLIQKAPEPAGT